MAEIKLAWLTLRHGYALHILHHKKIDAVLVANVTNKGNLI
jgi:hypothetical protein